MYTHPAVLKYSMQVKGKSFSVNRTASEHTPVFMHFQQKKFCNNFNHYIHVHTNSIAAMWKVAQLNFFLIYNNCFNFVLWHLFSWAIIMLVQVKFTNNQVSSGLIWWGCNFSSIPIVMFYWARENICVLIYQKMFLAV